MLTLCAVFAASSPATASGSPGHVLLVGTFHGVRGSFSTIQAAVDASKKGDWILIAPGDYHETADETPSAEDSSYASGASATDYSDGNFGGVLVDTPGITLRGMNRSKVIVDGTKAGAPKPCDPAPQYQNLGPTGTSGAEGRNGILIWKANNVSVENLTACNFLGGAGDSGNEVWWNGGANSGKIGLRGYNGSYLTATSTYFGGETTAAQYGIFSSNSAGTAEWNHLYASNFNDSGMYVGACKQSCGIVIDNAWMEYSALGYSGTNSGGSIVIENSQFDNNEDGADTNTAISGDGPAPANGACPGNAVSHITHTRSCWVFMHNVVRDNNNIDTPRAGSAAAGPTGTGMTVSGARNDTVMDNTFSDNGAWGILFVPYPDSGTPVLGQTCTGTGGVENSALGCIYDPEGDVLSHNTFVNDGYFKNPSNSDYGQITFNGQSEPQNCFSANKAPQGSSPADLEKIQSKCGPRAHAANTGGALLAQVLCDTGFAACPADAHYPQVTSIVMHPLPKLRTMPDPCSGVPANAWCKGGKPI